MLFSYLVLGYLALYVSIWLHEVGHAIMYKKYGCKENPFKVKVPVYLFFSTPAPVDEQEAARLSLKQNFNVGIAGIVVNILFGIPLFLTIKFGDFSPHLVYFFFLMFAVFHLVEAVSYLIISNISLSSDMIMINAHSPRIRKGLFGVGLIVLVALIDLIIQSPSEWRLGIILTSLVCAISMGGGRAVFSRRRQ